jgi:hypothetical protein
MSESTEHDREPIPLLGSSDVSVPLDSMRADGRPRMPEPPPVRLIAIADVHLPAARGREKALDTFYVTLLGFHRDTTPEGFVLYRAEKHAIVFDLLDPPIERDRLPMTGIEVESLYLLERALLDQEYPHERVRSVEVGIEQIVVCDPAGNWLAICERSFLA